MKVLKKLGLKIRLDRPNIVFYPDIFRKIVQVMNKFWLILKLFKLNNSAKLVITGCSSTGKPTHLFRTKCASLDSV